MSGELCALRVKPIKGMKIIGAISSKVHLKFSLGDKYY